MIIPISPQDAPAFVQARRATSRGACDRFLRDRGLTPGTPDYEAQKRSWAALPLLLGREVLETSWRAIGGARAGAIGPETPFPSMLWYGGATDTFKGFRFKGGVADFVKLVLEARATEVAVKRTGWVVTPTSNSDGHRVNASTLAMHALNLDCDGAASWETALARLEAFGLAYIAYQSGGWSPTTSKWHLLLPLARPFDLCIVPARPVEGRDITERRVDGQSSPEKILAWRAAYATARTVFGAIAELPGEGFDSTVDAPAIPIFITERRSTSDPPRQVVWRPGLALDLEALVAQLPPPVPEEVRGAGSGAVRAPLDIEALDDDRLEEIVAALCRPMSKLLSGRRDLYMALPGALLDRGLEPDDVLAIIEEVSDRCPGDPRYTRAEIADKHREHVHCAETTIARYDRGETYVRIGTIVERWPTVVAAIDEVLPNERVQEARELIARFMARGETQTVETTPGLSPAIAEAAPIPQAIALDSLVKVLKRHRRGKDKKYFQEAVQWAQLDALIEGRDLAVRDGGPGSPYVLNEQGKPLNRERSLASLMGMMAYVLPKGTSFTAIAPIVLRAVSASLVDGERTDDLMKKAEYDYLDRLGRRIEDDRKKSEREADRRGLAKKYLFSGGS